MISHLPISAFSPIVRIAQASQMDLRQQLLSTDFLSPLVKHKTGVQNDVGFRRVPVIQRVPHLGHKQTTSIGCRSGRWRAQSEITSIVAQSVSTESSSRDLI